MIHRFFSVGRARFCLEYPVIPRNGFQSEKKFAVSLAFQVGKPLTSTSKPILVNALRVSLAAIAEIPLTPSPI